MNIRFDNHPQPYIRATYSSNKEWIVTMEDWPGAKDVTADQYRWKPFIFARRHTLGGEWRQEKEYPLDWDHMKGASLKVIFINMELRKALSYDPSSGQPCFEDLHSGNLSALLEKVYWEVECVDHNLSANEVAATFLVPAAVVLIISVVAVVAFLAVEVGPEIFEGLSKAATELLKVVLSNAPKLSKEKAEKSKQDIEKMLDARSVVGIKIEEFADMYSDPSKAQLIAEIELSIINILMRKK